MQNAFEYQINKLVGSGDYSFLLAVSGGIDSMVMASLFVASQHDNISITHVNFGLRGKESDLDESFVREWADKHRIPCFVQQFDTRLYAANLKISVEMAARKLRYQWFEELRQEKGFDFIAVAHQSNDQAETLLLNMTRGTGIKGLHGISPKRDHLIRPMLMFNRALIVEYAREKNVPFREDVTNASCDFSRNRIRHCVLPELKKINPNVVERFKENARYFQLAGCILEELLEEKKREWCRHEGEVLCIEVEKVVKDSYSEFWLFELLRPYGFGERKMKQVVDMVYAQSGRRMKTDSHTLYKDRGFLVLIPFEKRPSLLQACEHFSLSLFDASEYVVKNSFSIAALDADKLHFPLVKRLWQRGDRFVPLGMSGFKKVSDFLIDAKVSLWEKERQQVLCSNKEIVWVVGRRIDNRFKVSTFTKRVAEISIE